MIGWARAENPGQPPGTASEEPRCSPRPWRLGLANDRPLHTSAGQTWEGGQGRPGLF